MKDISVGILLIGVFSLVLLFLSTDQQVALLDDIEQVAPLDDIVEEECWNNASFEILYETIGCSLSVCTKQTEREIHNQTICVSKPVVMA